MSGVTRVGVSTSTELPDLEQAEQAHQAQEGTHSTNQESSQSQRTEIQFQSPIQQKLQSRGAGGAQEAQRSPSDAVDYTSKPGDTLAWIAAKLSGNSPTSSVLQELLRLNPQLGPPHSIDDEIPPGTKIRLPRTEV